MALKTFVKISSVNNLTDARYCAGMYVNQIGFDLDDSSTDKIHTDRYKEITDWLSGVQFVGEFSQADPEAIVETVKLYPGIAYIETDHLDHLIKLRSSGYGLILRQQIGSDSDLEDLLLKAREIAENQITLSLISDAMQSEGSTALLLRQLAEKCEVLLGFGVTASNVANVLESTGIKGIVMEAGDEIKPGFKDFEQLAEILEVLEIED